MNIKTKIASAAMAAVMAVGFTACSQNYTWVAKSGDLEIAPGVYMANLLGAYSNALTLVSDTEKDVLEQTIEDKNASDWITEQAKISTAQYFAVEQKFDEYSLVLNSDDLSTISQQTEYYWQYLSSLYEDNGISQDSLNLINTNVYKTSLLFDALYGEGGEKEVSDDELKQAYLNDYVKTTFYALSLTDSSGELLSEEDQAAVRERIQNIYDKANAGDDFYDLILEDEKSDLGEDDTVHEHTGVEHDAIIYKEDATSFPEGFYDIIKAINTDSYDMFEIDNYVVVAKRLALDTESEEFENSKASILSNLKGDEFMELIEQWGNETEVTYNEDALKVFTPSKVKYE